MPVDGSMSSASLRLRRKNFLSSLSIEVCMRQVYTRFMERVFAVVDITKDFPNLNAFKTVGELMTVVVTNAFVVAGILSFVILVIGGVQMVAGAGSGDPKQAEQGKQALGAAVIGLVLVVLSYFIVQIIEIVTGLHIISPVIQ